MNSYINYIMNFESYIKILDLNLKIIFKFYEKCQKHEIDCGLYRENSAYEQHDKNTLWVITLTFFPKKF